RFAIDGGYDFVVFLDARDESATQSLKAVIERYRQTRADVVLVACPPERGSRSWRGKIADALQRRLTGRDVSRYAGSCRGFATRLLRTVPFECNSNGDVFGTELLLQACYVGARIEEVPAAGDSIACGVARAGGVGALAAALQFKLHQFG